MCHPERSEAESNFCAMKKVAKQLCEWSKSARTQSSGIYEGILPVFCRGAHCASIYHRSNRYKRANAVRPYFSYIKKDSKTRYKIPTPAALPSLRSGSTAKTAHRALFSAQDDTLFVTLSMCLRACSEMTRCFFILFFEILFTNRRNCDKIEIAKQK